MTHDELLAKAIRWLREMKPKLPDSVQHATVDQLPKRRIRDAVVIEFESDENRDKIQITLDRDTGAILGANWPTPKKQSDANAV